MRQRSFIVSGAALAVLGIAGGAAPTSAGGGFAGGSCDLPLADSDEDELDGSLVVLLDGTVSSEGQLDRVDDVVDLLDAATADDLLAVSLGSFGGSDAEVRFSDCLDGTPFTPQGNNSRTRARNRPALIEAAGAELDGLADGYETSDPTAALRAGVARLAGSFGRRSLVVHTDGIPTAGCAALPEQTDVSTPGLVDELVGRCVDGGQLPEAAGVVIVIGGVGRTDQDLSADAVTFLIELNTALCEATGGTCRVDPNLPTEL